MADRREVSVDLVTRLKDKGFKDLQKQTSRTERQLQKFGRRLTAVFSTAVLARFLKKSVLAFSENEKALRRLNIELQNVNLGFAAGLAQDFIRNLSLATGIADDELNPALQRLVRSTKTLTDAQKLLTLAVDISKGTGKDLNSITIALERAYLGQNTALAKLNIGYTTATLKGKEFDDILRELQKRYTGTALATQDDLATSIDRLKVAFEEAQEAIGEGFIKGLEQSGTSVDELIPKLIKTGEAIGVILSKVTTLIDKFSFLVTAFDLFKNKADDFAASQRASELAIRSAILSDFERLGVQIALAQQEAKNAKIRARELAKLAAQEKKRASEKRRTAEIERLRNAISFKFDIEAINQQAALRRNISKEDRDRVLQLAALKISDYQTDEEAIKTLEAATTGRYNDAINLEKVYQLLKAAGFASDQAAIKALDALEPSIEFKDNLDSIIAKLKALIEGKYTISIGATITVPPVPQPGTSASSGIGPGSTFDPGSFRKADEGRVAPGETYVPPAAVIKPPFIDLPGEIGGEPAFAARPSFPDIASFRRFEETASSDLRNLYGPSAVPSNFDIGRFRMRDEGVTVNVNVSGSLISQNDLVAAVTDAVYQTQRSGNSLLIAE